MENLKIKIDNVNNKLGADMWMHLGTVPVKPHNEVVAQVVDIESDGEIICKANVFDYYVGRLFEFSEALLMMASGKGWEELKAVYGPDVKLALYVFKKVKEEKQDGTGAN